MARMNTQNTDEMSASLASLRIDRSLPPPSKGRGKWVVGILILGVATLAGLELKPKLEAAVFKTVVETTTIVTVSPAQASVELTATGYVRADRKSTVVPKIPGRVLVVNIRQGQEVKAGDVLIELDPSDDAAQVLASQSRVAAARAQADGVQAQIATAEAELGETKLQAERERRLANQGVTPKVTAEDLEARVISLSQRVLAAKAAAKAATAQASALASEVNVLKTGMENLTLTAPIDGVIVSEPPQVGEYIGPTPDGAGRMTGIVIADFSTLQIETDIPETRLSKVKQGAPAEIALDAFGTERFRGRVKQITPEVDRAKATVVVKVEFLDPPAGLLPEMSARVSLLSKELDVESLKAAPKTIVPKSAVLKRNGANVVFVKDGDQVRMVPIDLGPAFGEGFELISGPSSGASVVKNPTSNLQDGQRVKDAASDS
jgi:HlyD family secretion protein